MLPCDRRLVGNVTSIAESYPGGLNNRTVTNTYDAINRLELEQVSGSPSVSSSYAYDSANNRTGLVVTGGPSAGSTTYSYNSLNQLTGYGNGARTVSLVYDADGNRGGRIITGGTDEGFDSYSYDFENRLVQVQGNHGASGTRTYSYGYDYRTRRVLRNESQAGGASTQVVFSGGLSVEEYASGSGTGTPTVEYVRGSDYGGGVGGVLYTLRSGAPSYTHENRRGDVVAKTDASGNLTYQAQYQAFGSQVATTGSTQDRQQANTKDEDPTGLLNEGMRYYDLDSGEFMTKDPAGFVDGPNLYTYVNQNPWTKFDPEGLASDDDDVGTLIMQHQQQLLDAEGKVGIDTTQARAETRSAQQAAGVFADGAQAAAELDPVVAATEAATGKSPAGTTNLSTGDRVMAAGMAVPVEGTVEAVGKAVKELIDAFKVAKDVGEVGKIGEAGVKIEQSAEATKEATQTVENAGVHPLDPNAKAYPDITGKEYEGDLRPDQVVVDHVKNRASGGSATDVENLDPKTIEANSRKAGFEGNLAKDRQRMIDSGMDPADVDKALAPEQKWD